MVTQVLKGPPLTGEAQLGSVSLISAWHTLSHSSCTHSGKETEHGWSLPLNKETQILEVAV